MFDYFIVDLIDSLTDDDLMLTTLIDITHDALGVPDAIDIDLGIINDIEAQAGHAMCDIAYVVFATDSFDHIICDRFEIVCHTSSLFTSIFAALFFLVL